MILISVENLTLKEFISALGSRKFNIDEFNQFITDFYKEVEKQTEIRLKEERKRLNAIDIKMSKINLEKEYYDEMEFIDERILERSVYIEKIEIRNKYRENANAKRKTCNN
jgi:hypothetical protein